MVIDKLSKRSSRDGGSGYSRRVDEDPQKLVDRDIYWCGDASVRIITPRHSTAYINDTWHSLSFSVFFKHELFIALA